MGAERVLIAVASLAAGGTERVVSLLAGAWARRGRSVWVVTVAGSGHDFFELPPGVGRLDLGHHRAGRWSTSLARFAGRAARLRGVVRTVGPDCLVSFGAMTNVLAVAAVPAGVPVVVSERTHPPRNSLGSLRDRLRVAACRHAGAVVAQTDRTARWIEAEIDRSCVVIPNPVDPRFRPGPAPRARTIVSVGRLAPEKGHALLIEAWRRVEATFPDWRLWLVGDGPEREALERAGRELVERERLGFAGATREPEHWLRSAGVFVLPSRFEGFPNALLEAMASGCAAIAADCEVGPAELIGPAGAGLLVPPGDAEALASGLATLLGDAPLRTVLGSRAVEAAGAYALDEIAARWESVLDGAVRRPAGRRRA